MSALKEHYTKIAESFLQTAIVIDDQATFNPVTVLHVTQLKAPSGSLLESAESEETTSETSVAVDHLVEAQVTALNAKVLTEAFLEKNMICGLYQPAPGEDMVSRTIGAAEAADMVVVDWHLESGSSRGAKDIILGLLRADRSEKGRLRLVAIYTGQGGREAIAQELFVEIEKAPELAGAFRRVGTVIHSLATRIVILNKRNTPEGADWEEVTEEALPVRLISEFAELSQGILSSFALAAVAAIRRGAHHMLSLYSSDLDGAFIAHRCGIPIPDDSKNFALDIITSDLRNLIEVGQVAQSTLDLDLIISWVEDKTKSGHSFRTDQAEVSVDKVKKFVEKGSRAVEKAFGSQRGPVSEDDPRESLVLSCGSLSRIFYADAGAAKLNSRRMARLSTFQREAGRMRHPAEWFPLLTLGSLIQQSTGELLLCVQPRCDSIRLKTATAFPFQTVTQDDDKFNLVIPGADDSNLEVWVNLKPRDARMINFEPHAGRKAVLGQREEGTDRFLFQDTEGKKYVWLGDLKEMKAQRWAGVLGSRVQSIGIEELEFLRWAGERRLRPNWFSVGSG